MPAKPEIRGFFDEPTNTVSYLVWDASSKDGVVIDRVLNFDHRSGEATVESADAMLAEAKKLGIKIGTVLETHAHADHLSGALYQAQDRRQSRNRRAHQGRAENLPSDLQRHRRLRRRLGVRSFVQGR